MLLPFRLLSPAAYRRLPWRAAAVALLAAGLAACQAPPAADTPAPVAAAAPSAAERKAAVLRQYGFEPTDAGWELQMAGKLLFDFDSAQLQPQARDKLLRLGHGLTDVGIDALRVEGHTDEQGVRTYNERLSLRRAEAVAQVLAEGGLARDRLEVVGLGSSRPAVAGGSRTASRENRRVAVIVPAF